MINNRQCTNFNSIKVRLEHKDSFDLGYMFPNFNSIKVRLEHVEHFVNENLVEFQFHKGTIRTTKVDAATKCY